MRPGDLARRARSAPSEVRKSLGLTAVAALDARLDEVAEAQEENDRLADGLRARLDKLEQLLAVALGARAGPSR